MMQLLCCALCTMRSNPNHRYHSLQKRKTFNFLNNKLTVCYHSVQYAFMYSYYDSEENGWPAEASLVVRDMLLLPALLALVDWIKWAMKGRGKNLILDMISICKCIHTNHKGTVRQQVYEAIDASSAFSLTRKQAPHTIISHVWTRNSIEFKQYISR